MLHLHNKHTGRKKRTQVTTSRQVPTSGAVNARSAALGLLLNLKG